jgi:hypothetical protein
MPKSASGILKDRFERGKIGAAFVDGQLRYLAGCAFEC